MYLEVCILVPHPFFEGWKKENQGYIPDSLIKLIRENHRRKLEHADKTITL